MKLDGSADRLVPLVVLALASLVGRAVAARIDSPPVVDRGLYLLALGCLVACVFVLVDEQR